MRTHLLYRTAIAAVALLAAACAKTANVEQEKAALLAADKEWSQSTKDADKFVSFYVADATTYPPGMPKTTGAQNIKKGIAEMMALPGFSLQWTPETADVGAAGDLGYTAGSYTLTMQNGAGNPVTDKGKYINIWRKQSDGKWKVAADTYNSDLPEMPMSAPHVTLTGAGLKWMDAPPVFPAGAKFTVLSGDPSKPGPYALRLQLPSGYRLAPHWHPSDENVTVISGSFAIGMGDTFDQKALKDLPAGGYTSLPATMHHYAMARSATTVQVNGNGPFAITYVNPADDPSKK